MTCSEISAEDDFVWLLSAICIHAIEMGTSNHGKCHDLCNITVKPKFKPVISANL